MDWDRRAFVKFAVGGVTGLTFSPLIWKLMDDSAIWTQNWNWVPDPADGALAKANSFNPATGTAVKIRLIDSRIIPTDKTFNPDGKAARTRGIRVEGNTDYPLGGEIGGVVPQDASALQNTYMADVRVTAPMVLDKTTGVYKEVSWGQAIDLVAAKLAELKGADKAQTVAAFGDDPDSTTGGILKAFMASYGSPNLAFTPRAADTLALAGGVMLGNEQIGFDLAAAKYVLCFGTPLLEGFGAPVSVRAAYVKAKDAGVKLVQIEDRASVTASLADEWVACAAGAEGALALAMCQVLIAGGKAASGAGGLSEFTAMVNDKFTPEKVAEQTGIKAEKIVALANEFAAADKAVAICGPGPGNEPGRLGDFMAVLALNALGGKLGMPGGVVVRGDLPLKPMASPDSPAAPLKGAANLPMGGYNGLALAQAALAGDPYELNMVILAGANPAYSGPQAGVFGEMLRKVPFVVAISSYIDESATLADVLLPAGTFLECWGDATTPYGQAQASYGVHRPLLKVQPKCKSVGDALLLLAAKLGGPVGGALPYKTLEGALKARYSGDFAKLAEQGWWVQEKVSYGAAGSVDLQAATMAKTMGHTSEDHGHTLTLAAVPSVRTCNNGQPITPHMIKILSDDTLRFNDQTVVEINPETAHHLHLHDGDAVTVDSTEGGFTARVKFFAGARPGMVYMPVGLGHTAFGFYRKGKGGNYNSVVKAEADAVTGLPAWGLTPVTVRKG